jgi:hypothetical protein
MDKMPSVGVCQRPLGSQLLCARITLSLNSKNTFVVSVIIRAMTSCPKNEIAMMNAKLRCEVETNVLFFFMNAVTANAKPRKSFNICSSGDGSSASSTVDDSQLCHLVQKQNWVKINHRRLILQSTRRMSKTWLISIVATAFVHD